MTKSASSATAAASIQRVESLVQLLPVSHVAKLVDLHWHTVKTIDKQRLKRDLPAPDKTRLRRLWHAQEIRRQGNEGPVIGAAEPPWRTP